MERLTTGSIENERFGKAFMDFSRSSPERSLADNQSKFHVNLFLTKHPSRQLMVVSYG